MTGVERVWLRHPSTGGYFHCPVLAVKDWRELGWEPSDPPPPDPNPVVAERIGWEQHQEAQREAAAAEAADDPAPETKPTSKRQSAAPTTPEET